MACKSIFIIWSFTEKIATFWSKPTARLMEQMVIKMWLTFIFLLIWFLTEIFP